MSKADMMLDAQNIAAHFPELGEVMGKALESNTYMVTRLDKMVGKLKGGVKEDAPKSTAPEVEMEELTGAPPVKGEEAMLDVGEEPVPPAPAAIASLKNRITVLSNRR